MIENQFSYNELNERLKYPVNPAYLPKTKKLDQMDLTFLDFCRQQKIPFNKADQILYELTKTEDTYEICKVHLDQAFEESDHLDQLPNGKVIVGWPSRITSSEAMVRDFKLATLA